MPRNFNILHAQYFNSYSNTNLAQAWYLVDNLRHIWCCSNKTNVQICMNVKNSGNNLMFIIVRKENWIVVEFDRDNVILVAAPCWCNNPISINHSTDTKIILLLYGFKLIYSIFRKTKYRTEPHKTAIIFIMGTKYDCNVGHERD